MRHFKKYFFESLIQLTILATVFRQNSRFSELDSEPLFNQENSFNYFNGPGKNINGSLYGESHDQFEFLDNINRAKDTENLFNELRRQRRSNQLVEQGVRSRNQQNIVLQPASAFYPMDNQKRIIDHTETRILLNSIELNNNNNRQFRKEFEMDIELQTLIEQDIDLGIKNSEFYDIGQHKFDFMNKKDFMNENQKDQDILSATEIIANEINIDKYKLRVEEDTGEIMYQYNESKSNNSNIENYQQNLKNNVNDTNRNLTTKEMPQVEMNMKHKPNNQQIVFTKPIFLSQTSVSKELNKLNENIASTSQSVHISESSANISSFPALDERMLDEYLEENLLTNDAQKTSFDIQQDLETADLNTNQDADMMPDVFEFDEDFLKTFESNLTKFNSNNDSNNGTMSNQNTVYFNQTILNNNTENSLINTHLRNQTVISIMHNNSDNTRMSQNENQTMEQNETISLNFLSDQLDLSLNDIFKTLDNTQTNNFTTFNNLTNKNHSTCIMNKSVLLSHDDIKNFNVNNSSNIDLKKEAMDVDESKFLIRKIPSTAASVSLTYNQAGGSQSAIYSNIPNASEATLATIRGLNHNHTYMNGVKSEEDSEIFHPYSYKNKLKKMLKNLKNNDMNNTRQQESRDQILLQENNINLSIHHIVDSNADEFNELVKSSQLNGEQLSIVKDIRRRGKNKVAAQICRKRKIDSIDSLREDTEHLSEMKASLDQEQDHLEKEINDLTMKFDELYHDLMGEEYDMNDPIIIYMNNLKTQLNINAKMKQLKNSQKSVSNSDESDNTSQISDLVYSDYEEENESIFHLENLISNKKIKLESHQVNYLSNNKKFKN